MAEQYDLYLSLDHWTIINTRQIVWVRDDPDSGVTVFMASPGPDGKHEFHVTEPKAVEVLRALVNPGIGRRVQRRTDRQD